MKNANSAIKVVQRFAYEEVMPIVEHPEKFKTKVTGKVLTSDDQRRLQEEAARQLAS